MSLRRGSKEVVKNGRSSSDECESSDVSWQVVRRRKTRKTGEEDVEGERRKRGLKNKRRMTMREAQLRQTRTKNTETKTLNTKYA